MVEHSVNIIYFIPTVPEWYAVQNPFYWKLCQTFSIRGLPPNGMEKAEVIANNGGVYTNELWVLILGSICEVSIGTSTHTNMNALRMC